MIIYHPPFRRRPNSVDAVGENLSGGCRISSWESPKSRSADDAPETESTVTSRRSRYGGWAAPRFQIVSGTIDVERSSPPDRNALDGVRAAISRRVSYRCCTLRQIDPPETLRNLVASAFTRGTLTVYYGLERRISIVKRIDSFLRRARNKRHVSPYPSLLK